MRKIGILTLVFFNYGTRLQSYALCKVLEEILDGNETEVEVINIEGCWSNSGVDKKKLIFKIIKSYGLRSISHIIELYRWVRYNRRNAVIDRSEEIKKRKSTFTDLIAKIPYTEKRYTCQEIREGKLPEYDAILVGSDQVWNGIKVGNQDVYMLDFLKGKKGLTYAASFGMTTFPAEMNGDYARRINNFSSLLIREKEGVEMCKLLGRNDAKHVLDPTLLLRKSDYEPLISKEKLIEGDYVLVYSLNFSYKIYDEAYRLAKRNNCKMVVLKRSFCPPEISKYKGAIELYTVSPEQFLSLIENSKCVITNSYHALLFSINFQKNYFLYLDNADEENSRLLTISKMCHLQDRVFWETQRLPSEISGIDYNPVMKLVVEETEKSKTLLKESITSYFNN